jgi:glucose-6-phosphate 1-epimerase
MKLSFAALVFGAVTADAFVVQTPSAGTTTASASRTALFDSRNRQKIASRTEWLEARGMSSTGSEAATTGKKAGLFTNDQGLEYVKLVHPKTGASSEIYLFGGDVTSYCDADGTEFIAVRPDAKMDGSKPISGGLSHCFPQFGPGAIQQHGFARNVNWSVTKMSDTSVEIQMAPSDYTKAMWDKEFLCTFTVSVEPDQLKTKLLVENKGSEAFDFQAALHSYMTVSSLDKLEIAGSFAGKKFLNKLAGSDGKGEIQTEERSAITITEEYDRIYSGTNDPVLKDAGKGKSLAVINEAGWADTVIWSPYGNEGMGYNNFVCVESAKIDPVTMAGGASWEGVMALKPSAM